MFKNIFQTDTLIWKRPEFPYIIVQISFFTHYTYEHSSNLAPSYIFVADFFEKIFWKFNLIQ